MNIINDKKARRMIINNTKQVLKGNTEILKQEFNLEVPKNILNMDNWDFYVFVTEIAYPAMKNVKTTNPEILDVIGKLQACVKAFRHYHREVYYKRPTMFTK